VDEMIIFGFGSLINLESLKMTVPDAHDIQPAYIKGFKRDFSVWDAVGFTESNLDVAGEGMCALDVTIDSKPDSRVNGIIFKTGRASYKRLIKRESLYKILKIAAYNFENNDEIGECLVFSANKNNGSYDFNSKAQKRYLEICLGSARQYGERYYKEFLRSTFIGDKSLDELPQFSVII
jgi:cation transport regulator ChaC